MQVSIPIPSTQIVFCIANSVILHLNYQFLIRWVKIYFCIEFWLPFICFEPIWREVNFKTLKLIENNFLKYSDTNGTWDRREPTVLVKL